MKFTATDISCVIHDSETIEVTMKMKVEGYNRLNVNEVLDKILLHNQDVKVK